MLYAGRGLERALPSGHWDVEGWRGVTRYEGTTVGLESTIVSLWTLDRWDPHRKGVAGTDNALIGSAFGLGSDLSADF